MTRLDSTPQPAGERGMEKAAVVCRGDTAESVHCAAIAVVDGNRRLIRFLGDPYMMTATRSSVKPFQALPLVRSGGADKLGLTSKQLAIICASHNGSDEHRAAVQSVLEAAGNNADHLKCGTHWPLEMRLLNEFPKGGEELDPVRHNCSGKHAGFLALARLLGVAPEEYIDPESKLQQQVREAVGVHCEYPPEDLDVAIDGCSAPVFSMPLVNLAIGFQKLAAGLGESGEPDPAVVRIRNVMQEHPLMVSGNKRLDYDLARSLPKNVVCKVGAEAVQGIGLADPPLGIAVKVLDGAARARDPISLETLVQMGVIDDVSAYPFLQPYVRPEVRNYRKLLTGRIVPEFVLHEV
jgi:L-asparaginase II